MIKIFHLNMLTKDERKRLNAPDGGWDSDPRFTRYADISSFGNIEQALVAMSKDEYSHVATVEGDDLEDAWCLTNHIESDWTKNDGVKPERGDHRSSSVGDIFVVDGKPRIVARCGFEELS